MQAPNYKQQMALKNICMTHYDLTMQTMLRWGVLLDIYAKHGVESVQSTKLIMQRNWREQEQLKVKSLCNYVSAW